MYYNSYCQGHVLAIVIHNIIYIYKIHLFLKFESIELKNVYIYIYIYIYTIVKDMSLLL